MSIPIRFILNQQLIDYSGPTGLTVLSYLRDQIRLTGAKEGCREGDCGACTVMIGVPDDNGVYYRPAPACLVPMAELHGKHLVTIEGLNQDSLSPVQQALVDEGAVQCGFCTPGIVISLVCHLLQAASRMEPPDIKSILSGHLCRCTGYSAIKRAAARLAGLTANKNQAANPRMPLMEAGVLPAYFAGIPERLARIEKASEMNDRDILVAGGTDLLVQKGESLQEGNLHSLYSRRDLTDIRQTADGLLVGSLTTIEEFIRHPLILSLIPDIAEYGECIASWQVRSRATLAGNIINASPIADMTILLLALQAQIELDDGHNKRRLELADFFLDYKKLDKSQQELLTRIFIPRILPDTRIHFEKVAKRKHLDIASVNSAIKIREKHGRVSEAAISCGGVAPIPLLLRATGRSLTGKPLHMNSLKKAVQVMEQEIRPISDVRGSADYKRLLARQLLMAHFLYLYPEVCAVQEALWIC